jgi:hypothetical protein
VEANSTIEESSKITMYAIRRHRAAKNAWCWRVNFRRRGKAYSKSFHDLTCGGSKKAKAAAVGGVTGN